MEDTNISKVILNREYASILNSKWIYSQPSIDFINNSAKGFINDNILNWLKSDWGANKIISDIFVELQIKWYLSEDVNISR